MSLNFLSQLSLQVHPSDLDSLTKITKQVSTKDETAFKTFKRLFRDISDTSELQRLAALIRYLGDNTYNARIENLREIING